MDGQPPAKRSKVFDASLPVVHESGRSGGMLSDFMLWLSGKGCTLSQKIKLTNRGTSSRYGAVAVENIEMGEILFTIPRNSVLSEKTCSVASSLANVEFNDESGWVKLVLAMMHEYTNANSTWKPYLNFLPPAECMDQPMFWSPSERTNLLKGSSLDSAVELDMKKMEREYNSEALPFIRQHANLGFDPNVHSLQLYMHMVALIMAYSFTEPENEADEEGNTPMMVPLADALNHVAQHNAELEFTEASLVMKSISAISVGEEIYNTYGQISNSQLLQMYGFVLEYPNNLFDTVDVELSLLFDAAAKTLPAIDEKRKWMHDEVNLDGKFPITIGLDGILCVDEFHLLMKVLPMKPEEFEAFKQKDMWESLSEYSDEKGEFEAVSDERLIDHPLTPCLVQAVKACSQRLKTALTDDKPADGKTDTGDMYLWRVARSKALVRGQRKLLKLLVHSVQKQSAE